MLNHFKEYYRYPKDKYKKILEEGVIVFDTNALLDLYRFDIENQKIMLELIEKTQDQLMLPYWVAKEFSKNRQSVIISKHNQYNLIKKFMSSSFQQVELELDSFFKENEKKLQAIFTDEKKKFKDILHKANQSHLRKVDELINQQTNGIDLSFLQEDAILEKVMDLINNKLNISAKDKYDEDSDDFEQLRATGRDRYAKKTPPGFMDDTEKDEPYKFGDYFIWEEVLNYCTEKEKACILVSRDTKKDWVEKSGGLDLGPRFELKKEFHERTNDQSFLLFTPSDFISVFSKKYGIEATDLVQQAKEIEENASIGRPDKIGSPTITVHNTLKNHSALRHSSDKNTRVFSNTLSKINSDYRMCQRILNDFNHSMEQYESEVAMNSFDHGQEMLYNLLNEIEVLEDMVLSYFAASENESMLALLKKLMSKINNLLLKYKRSYLNYLEYHDKTKE